MKSESGFSFAIASQPFVDGWEIFEIRIAKFGLQKNLNNSIVCWRSQD